MNPETGADILLVEDNPDDVEFTLRTLKKAGLGDRVRVARTGLEALDYLFGTGRHKGIPPETLPRLVLLDLRLPGATGLRILQWIRAESSTRDLPVAILTAFDNDPDVVEIYKLGVIKYFKKPLQLTELQSLAARIGLQSSLT